MRNFESPTKAGMEADISSVTLEYFILMAFHTLSLLYFPLPHFSAPDEMRNQMRLLISLCVGNATREKVCVRLCVRVEMPNSYLSLHSLHVAGMHHVGPQPSSLRAVRRPCLLLG